MAFIEILLLLVIIWILMTQRDPSRPNLPPSKHKSQLLVDSCGLIDGRIVELTKTGFIDDTLVFPQFVLNELQLLADGQDAHKRERARFGLDIAQKLQSNPDLNVTIDQNSFQAISATDDKLIALAKKIGARLYTTDYNLSKVASLQGIKVLNINDLALDLRPTSLPGEKVTVKIIQKGNNPNQGVGYLEDGTMIVVDNALKLIGTKVQVTVDQMHQTASGKMIFAHLSKTTSPSNSKTTTVISKASHKRSVRERMLHTKV